jgi:hypothetical protein
MIFETENQLYEYCHDCISKLFIYELWELLQSGFLSDENIFNIVNDMRLKNKKIII